MPAPPETKLAQPITRLAVVIPVQDEEGCIASPFKHLHLELSLHKVPQEIIVVDDGSLDETWEIPQRESQKGTLRAINARSSYESWIRKLLLERN